MNIVFIYREHDGYEIMPGTDSRKRLLRWFSQIPAEKRIELAEEAEVFRREARIAGNTRRIQGSKR